MNVILNVFFTLINGSRKHFLRYVVLIKHNCIVRIVFLDI